jgi:hypothetical protein
MNRSDLNSPFSFIKAVAAAVPLTAMFFLNYLVVVVLTGLPVQLLGISAIELLEINIKRWRRVFLDGLLGLKKHNQMMVPLVTGVDTDMGVLVPSALFYMSLAIVFWVVSPLVLFITTLLFQGLSLNWKYLLCYVYVPSKQETGGVYWFQMVSYVMGSLLASTVMLVLYMSARGASLHTAFLFPLPLCIYCTWVKLDELLAGVRTVHCASLEQMLGVDELMKQQHGGENFSSFRGDFYVPRELQPL